MIELLRRVLTRVRRSRSKPPIPHGPAGIHRVGHRQYVGGLWEELGKLQFQYLLARGLRPEDYLLDIACGSLRGGVHFIAYLAPGHYLGIDKEEELIRAGIERELGRELYERQRPQLIVSAAFEFERFGLRPNFALAQSLFTHLTPTLIERCLGKLRPVIAEHGVLHATFMETPNPVANPRRPHDWGAFRYTRQQMEEFGAHTGWSATYVGDWNHPRRQMMMEFRPA